MLESGEYATIREIADAEKINETYVGRVLRLTLLAPELSRRSLNGRQPAGLQLDGLMRRFPVEWGEQRFLGRQRNLNGRQPARVRYDEPQECSRAVSRRRH